MSAFWSTSRARGQGLAVALALLLAGCSSGGGSTEPTDTSVDFGVNDPKLVVAMGDSITFGIFDNHVGDCGDDNRGQGGYPKRLQSLTGLTVVNAGICGEDSYQGLDRVTRVLNRYHPGVLLIDYSPNDLPSGTEGLIRNLRAMITAARNNKTVPILGTMVPATGEHTGWEGFIEDANTRIRSLCEEQGVECADLFAAFTADPGYISSPYALLTSDGLHPNPAGYELMAKTWRWPLLRVY